MADNTSKRLDPWAENGWNTEATNTSSAEPIARDTSGESESGNDCINANAIDWTPTISIDPGSLRYGSQARYHNLAPGTYTAKITQAVHGFHIPKTSTAKLGRCPQVTVHFIVETDEGSVDCKKIYYLVKESWAQKQMYFLFSAAGLIQPGTNSFTLDWDALIGRLVDIDVSDSEYNGKTYHNNITRIRKHTVKDDAAIDDDDLPF